VKDITPMMMMMIAIHVHRSMMAAQHALKYLDLSAA
jgi:hypothetical protein